MSDSPKLTDAKVIMRDKTHNKTLIWFGGEYIHVYDKKAQEQTVIGIPSEDRTEKEVRGHMLQLIQKGEYPDDR